MATQQSKENNQCRLPSSFQSRTWLSSQGHRSAMLDADAVSIGVAGYRGVNGKNYWVQQFKR